MTDSFEQEPNADAPEQPASEQRGEGGRFLPGNTVSVKAGIYSAEARRKAAAAKRDAFERLGLREFIDAVVSDMGGEEHMTALQRSTVEHLRDTEICIRMLVAYLSEHGLFTAKGRVRSCYSKLLESFSMFDRLAARLGFERKTENVLTPEAYWEQRSGGDSQ